MDIREHVVALNHNRIKAHKALNDHWDECAKAHPGQPMSEEEKATEKRINDELDDGRDVVLCRYWQSAWVYGQLDGLPAAWLEQVHTAMTQPDVSILLDVSPEEGMRRRAARDGAKSPERDEGDLARTRKIAELYRELWEDGWKLRPATRWSIVDASGPLTAVIGSVLSGVQAARS